MQKGSAIRNFFEANDVLFPTSGMYGQIYVGNLPEYGPVLNDIGQLVTSVTTKVDQLKGNGVDSFLPDFIEFVNNRTLSGSSIKMPEKVLTKRAPGNCVPQSINTHFCFNCFKNICNE